MDHGWAPDLSLVFFFFDTNLFERDIYGKY